VSATVIGNWKFTSVSGKIHKLVEETKRYCLDVVGISSRKRRGSSTVELDDGWKLSNTAKRSVFLIGLCSDPYL